MRLRRGPYRCRPFGRSPTLFSSSAIGRRVYRYVDGAQPAGRHGELCSKFVHRPVICSILHEPTLPTVYLTTTLTL